MEQFLKRTTVFRSILAWAKAGELPHASLIVFSDEKYLRPLLKECAAAYFGAEEGSRIYRLINEEHYADCHIYPAAGGKLTADDAAQILEESVLRPVEGEKKLFVLDAFHTTSTLIQNKLLKLLEEPPQGVYFLIGAAEEYAVLPTVLSRMTKLVEPPFSEADVEEVLLRSGGDRDKARQAALASGGVVSLAETLLAGGEIFRLAEEFLDGENVEMLCRGIEGKVDKFAFFAAVRLYLRDMLFIKTGFGRYAAAHRESAERLAQKYAPGALVAALGLVSDAERNVRFNANFAQSALALALGIREEKIKWQKLSQ